MNENNKKLIGFLGIGGFGLLAVNGFVFLSEIILRDLLFALKTKPIVNYWTTKIIGLTIFMIISFGLINKVFKSIEFDNKKMNRILFTCFGIYFVVQVFQFLYSYYGTQYILEKYLESFDNYYSYFRENPIQKSYGSLIVYFQYVVLVVFVYKKSNR